MPTTSGGFVALLEINHETISFPLDRLIIVAENIM